MLFIVLCIIGIVLLMFGVMGRICFERPIRDGIIKLGIGLIFIAMFFGVLFHLGFIVKNTKSPEYSSEPTLHTTVKIVNLQDVYDKTKGENLRINYISDGEEPHIDTYVYYELDEYTDEEKAYIHLFAPFIDDEKNMDNRKYEIAYYEIFIPQNSITEEYINDMN